MKPKAAVADVAQMIERARALVFDFDGTLVDSVPIKREAFRACFAEFPERLGEILPYCYNEHHTSRGEKFRHIYEHMLYRPFTKEIERSLHERFEAATTRQITELPEVPGVSRFLARVTGSHVTALLSSTPHEVLLDILDGRGWRDAFHAIQGAPVHKAAWMKRFRAAHALPGRDVIVFGDTDADARAAQAAGCVFVAIGDDCLSLQGLYAARDFMELTEAMRA